LQQLPFILVSGEETEEERVKARDLGVSDFVTKGAGGTEVLTRLNNLLALTTTRENLDAGREQMVHDPVSGLFTRKYLELQAAQAMSHASRHGVDVSVMVLGFDGFSGMCERFGEQVAEQVGNRFAKMLGGKMRHEDSLGHFGSGQFAVVSPGTAPAFCATFAERVREAVEVARLSVSVWPACRPIRLPRPVLCSIWLGSVWKLPCGLVETVPSRGAFCLPQGRFRFTTPLNCWPPTVRTL
jgi:diguanylate cyclase (GGDEF)-like protein